VDLAGRHAVVTGGASGIGRALCEAFAARGARGVVVADLDGAGAEAVAASLGDRAIAVAVDVSSEEQVVDLVRRAEAAFGPVDLFCANAGILVPGGAEVPAEDWQRSWDVNVASHVHAARAVLPSMLARGEGYLLHTASAAGLLTALGSAPYSVTKHAVVALAEWLAITHADAGIRVSCLCPQAVRTGMLRSASASSSSEVRPAARDGILEPERVAEIVLEALAEERFLVLPHPEVAAYMRRRGDDHERWLAGMVRSQRKLREG
jgi:NAD(P)-dependent dehydrogenase (short-subunit alcohol dehydrogenase family)